MQMQMEFWGPVNGDIVSQVLSDVLREGEFISGPCSSTDNELCA
jgi:hypothetical protein